VRVCDNLTIIDDTTFITTKRLLQYLMVKTY